jgi:hypothetical protein
VKKLAERRRLNPARDQWGRDKLLAEIQAVAEPTGWPLVQVVRLYEDEVRGTGERQHVAEIFTGSDPALRMRLYAAADDIFDRGDWFVVVRGEWLDTGKHDAHLRSLVPHRERLESGLRGEPISVAPAGMPGESCFRLTLSSGQSILLDLGSHDRPAEMARSDAAVFFSHAHPDHAGALLWALKTRLPVFLSATTLRVLDATGRLQGLEAAERRYLRPVADGTEITCEGLSVRHHRVPHCIGSVAWSFCGDAASLLYTGDVMLRTKAYGFDWKNKLKAITAALKGRVTVLLEASRAHAEGSAEDEALWPNLTALPRDVVVVGRDNPERLLFCYVQAYATVDKPRPDTSPIFVLTAGARLLLKACWNEVYPAGAVNPDVPFLKPGHNKWGVAESHALYWLDLVDRRALAQMDRQRLWFVDRGELLMLPALKNALVYDLRTGDTGPLHGLQGFQTERFHDRPGWTQHSHGVDVVATASDVRRLGARVILFHTRSANHQRIMQKHSCALDLIERPIDL